MARSAKSPSLVQRGRFDSPFFRSKFRVPSRPDHVVGRRRLTQLLDELVDYPITAIVAPAGAGKTTLAAEWVRSGEPRSAWLSLDEADREPAQFWTSVMTALDELAPGVVDRAMSLVRRPAGLDEALVVLDEDLDLADPSPGVLVIDDLHRLDADEVDASPLLSFVEHRPPWLHLMLLSRHRLSLPTARLRAGGQLADIAFDVLRFSDSEATEMLTSICPLLDPADLPDVVTRAGGWAAALQLAALAIRSRRVPHTTARPHESVVAPGSDRLIDDYVWHEVLEGERREMIDLLLATSVVDRVNFGLGEELTGRPDAGDLLMEAESRGLFVTSLDAGGWFEVHGLVREMLASELERRRPEQLREQHARAARWFESVGDEATALDHWLEAGRPREALRLLSEIAVSLHEGGRRSAIRRVLDAIPSEVSSADLDSMVRFAWCQLHVDRQAFLDALAGAVFAARGSDAPESLAALRILESVAAFANGAWQGSEQASREVLASLGDRELAHAVGPFGWNMVARTIALDERWDDDGAEIGEVRVKVSTDPDRRLAHEGIRAVGLALAGHPLDAMRVAAGVRHVAQSGALASLRTEVDLASALSYLELGDRERADAALTTLSEGAAYPLTYVSVLARLHLVGARIADGDLPPAEELFQRAHELAHEQFSGAGGSTWVAREGAALALASGDAEGAAHWIGRIDDPFWEARLHHWRGRWTDAVDALEQSRPRCVRHRVVRGLVLARATVNLRHDDALKAVEGAIELASEHGMLHTVASEATDLVDLVELAAWRVPEGWMHRFRRAVVPRQDAPMEHAAVLVEGLTDRERDVLRMLPSRLTLREIASELFVSQNTLKFHLRVIYRKLAVNSRSEAVEQARRMGLLSWGAGRHA